MVMDDDALAVSYCVKPFESLDAWRACHSLALAVYRATADFPQSERFGIVSQARRAAFSAPANIAEGSAKRGPREFRRFLDIALGSLSELTYALLFAREIGLLAEDEWKELDALREEAGRLTWGLYNYMRRQA